MRQISKTLKIKFQHSPTASPFKIHQSEKRYSSFTKSRELSQRILRASSRDILALMNTSEVSFQRYGKSTNSKPVSNQPNLWILRSRLTCSGLRWNLLGEFILEATLVAAFLVIATCSSVDCVDFYDGWRKRWLLRARSRSRVKSSDADTPFSLDND